MCMYSSLENTDRLKRWMGPRKRRFWKVWRPGPSYRNLRGPVYNHYAIYNSGVLKSSAWMGSAWQGGVTAEGFHVFRTKRAAEKWRGKSANDVVVPVWCLADDLIAAGVESKDQPYHPNHKYRAVFHKITLRKRDFERAIR